MPVEIKELVIRMTTSAAEPTTTSDGANATTVATPDQQALVEACVKQVLKILEKKKAR